MSLFIGVFMLGMPVAAILSAILYLPFFFALRKRHRPVLRHVTVYVLIVCCSLISLATIFLGGITFRPGYYYLNLKPFVWVTHTYEMGYKRMIGQLVLNVLMFVPLSVLLMMVFKSLRSLWRAALCLLSLTLLIECIQYFTGRSADVDDVIMNWAGGMIGYALFAGLNYLFRSSSGWKRMTGAADTPDLRGGVHI